VADHLIGAMLHCPAFGDPFEMKARTILHNGTTGYSSSRFAWKPVG